MLPIAPALAESVREALAAKRATDSWELAGLIGDRLAKALGLADVAGAVDEPPVGLLRLVPVEKYLSGTRSATKAGDGV
jgi:hypothetical protein